MSKTCLQEQFMVAGSIPINGTVALPGFRRNGEEIAKTVVRGPLCIKRPWPGIMRGVYGDPMRFQETYFIQRPGFCYTGDGAARDEDGYYQLMGRIDDVINVSGHRLGTAEVESALVAHEKVAKAAVVGYPNELKGQSIYAYVTLKTGVEKSNALKKGTGDACQESDRTRCYTGEASVGGWPAEDPQW